MGMCFFQNLIQLNFVEQEIEALMDSLDLSGEMDLFATIRAVAIRLAVR